MLKTRSVYAAWLATQLELVAWAGMTMFFPGTVVSSSDKNEHLHLVVFFFFLIITIIIFFFWALIFNVFSPVHPHSGSRSGHIHHHDVRVADHHIFTLNGHSQEVCGLKWSPDGRYLASGGNDNLVCVWPRVQEGSASNESQSVRCWSEHQGAVKVSSLILLLTAIRMTCKYLSNILCHWCVKCQTHFWMCYHYCRLWPGVHGSQTSSHLEVAPVIVTSVSGM